MDAARARKLADRISQIVAEMLERRIKDPRLGFITITEARLTNDLREATVFYTVYGSDAERADTAMALDPKSADAMYARGTIYNRQHETENARRMFVGVLDAGAPDWHFRTECIAALKATPK